MVQGLHLVFALCLALLPVQLLALYIPEERGAYWPARGSVQEREEQGGVAGLDAWREAAAAVAGSWPRDSADPRPYLSDLGALKPAAVSKKSLLGLLARLRHDQEAPQKRTLIVGGVEKKCYCADDIFCRRRRTADGFNC